MKRQNKRPWDDPKVFCFDDYFFNPCFFITDQSKISARFSGARPSFTTRRL
jgi:hypothetical protein